MYEYDVYLRTDDAARFLGCCKVTVLRMIHRGEFPSARLEETRGHRGVRAYEIAKSELVAKKYGQVPETNADVRKERPAIIPERVVTASINEQRRKAEILMALENVQSSMKLLSECIGDLVEKLI